MFIYKGNPYQDTYQVFLDGFFVVVVIDDYVLGSIHVPLCVSDRCDLDDEVVRICCLFFWLFSKELCAVEECIHKQTEIFLFFICVFSIF